MKKKTDELMNALSEKHSSIDNYLSENKDELIQFDVMKFWNDIIKKSGMNKTEIIDKADCGYNYFYCIISGKKIPSRDKIIELMIAMKLDVDDCQNALKVHGKAPLYPRIKRDSIIIHGINNHKSVNEINAVLKENNETTLKYIGEKK